MTKLTKEEYIIEAVNRGGSLFERKCLSVILELSDIRYITNNYPVKLDLDKKETEIDIIATIDAPGSLKYCIIECKRAHPDFNTWVFFPENKLRIDVPLPSVFDILSLDKDGSSHGRYLALPQNKYKDLVTAKDATEIKIKFNKNSDFDVAQLKKATKKDTIEDACNQVLIGSRGYSQKQNISDSIIKPTYFLPIVVTTAKLYTCQPDVKDISLDQGRVEDPKKANLKEVNWLIYNYRPNFLLNYRNQENYPLVNTASSIAGGIHFNYCNYYYVLDHILSIFVVNSEHFSDFLKQVINLP